MDMGRNCRRCNFDNRNRDLGLEKKNARQSLVTGSEQSTQTSDLITDIQKTANDVVQGAQDLFNAVVFGESPKMTFVGDESFLYGNKEQKILDLLRKN